MRHGSSLALLGTFLIVPSVVIAQEQPTPKSVTIAGTVTDGAHAAIPNAEVGLTLEGGKPVFVRVGNDGKFSFPNVLLVPGKLTARRLGYKTRTIPLDMFKVNAGEPLDIDLESLADELDTVTIDAKGGRMAEFYYRKNTSNFGYFIDTPEIKKRAPHYISELFRTIPGARIQVSRRIGNTITLRGCQPRIWVDGVRTQDSELDEIANVDEVAALEVYPSWAGTPPQYMDRETRACGTIVVWSRRD